MVSMVSLRKFEIKVLRPLKTNWKPPPLGLPTSIYYYFPHLILQFIHYLPANEILFNSLAVTAVSE